MDSFAGAGLYDLYISKIIPETHNTKSFQLTSTRGEILYDSGQFLTFIFPGKDNKELRRSYSLSSSPIAAEPMTITVKRIDNGEISRFLFDRACLGDKLTTIGASGFFTIPDNLPDYERLIFFAAGSGIVPVYSIIKSLLLSGSTVKIILVYSNNSVLSAVFFDQLSALQIQHQDRFTIEFLFSNSLHLRTARLTQESIQHIFSDHAIAALNKDLFYVCGPSDYMRMIQFELSTRNIAQSKIKREIFKIEKPAHIHMPPDINPHEVYIDLIGGRKKLRVEFPLTILAVAKKWVSRYLTVVKQGNVVPVQQTACREPFGCRTMKYCWMKK